jgi:hypothetical protein
VTFTRPEAEAHAHALEATPSMCSLGSSSIFEIGDETEAERETLLRMQDGAVLLLVGV